MKITSWLYTACIDFLILNLFITLASLPLLVAWGLPISWLSPLGNLIFSPFLSLFLLISTCSFFCELIGIPHAILDYLLEQLTALWHMLLQITPTHSFISFSATALYLLIILALITLFILMLPRMRTRSARFYALSLLFFCSLTILKATQPATVDTTLSCVNKKMQLIRNDHQTLLIDQGALCERTNSAAWVQYHLMPDLIKTTGSCSIDHLVITRPTIRALEGASAIIQHAQVGTVCYPVIEGELTGSYRTAFARFYAIAKEHSVIIKRIYRETALQIGNQTIAIVPKEKMQYRESTFKKIHCTTS